MPFRRGGVYLHFTYEVSEVKCLVTVTHIALRWTMNSLRRGQYLIHLAENGPSVCVYCRKIKDTAEVELNSSLSVSKVHARFHRTNLCVCVRPEFASWHRKGPRRKIREAICLFLPSLLKMKGHWNTSLVTVQYFSFLSYTCILVDFSCFQKGALNKSNSQ